MKCYNCSCNEAGTRLLVNYMGHAAEIFICTECLGSINAIFAKVRERGLASPRPYAWPNIDLREPPEDIEPREVGDDLFELDAGEEIRQRRRLAELREKLRRAVEREDYETAATLRDEIFRMEKEVCV